MYFGHVDSCFQRVRRRGPFGSIRRNSHNFPQVGVDRLNPTSILTFESIGKAVA